MHGAGLYRPKTPPVAFVTEKADWATRRLGESICAVVEGLRPGTAATTDHPARQIDRVVHFGSQYMWCAWGPTLARSNRPVVSFFHGKPEDGPEVARHIDEFLASLPRLSRVVTGATVVERRLLAWGVPRAKLVRIPIGTDTRLFRPPSAQQRRAAREKLGVPPGAVVIGSFQKDGVGWGDGMEPKLIKGPDVLLAVAAGLAKERPVYAIVSGPARGFVRAGFERLGVPHLHVYPQSHAEMVTCYHALDFYLMTSREEGGPMSLLEAMASGVPVVSTPVGMAPDLIEDGVTGGLAETAEGLVRRCLDLLALPDDGAALRHAARQRVVAVADWTIVGRAHLQDVYLPLL